MRLRAIAPNASRGRIFADAGGAPAPFLNVPNLLSFVWADGPSASPPVFVYGYTSNSTAALTKAAPNMTLTDALANNATIEVQGTRIEVGPGATTPANNGTFDVVSAPTAITIRYVNNAGVAEAYTGPYRMFGRVLALGDYVSKTYPYPWSGPLNATTPAPAYVADLVPGRVVLGMQANFPYALGDVYAQFGAPFAGDVDTSIAIRAYFTGWGKQLFTIDDGTDPPSSAVDRIQVLMNTGGNTATMTRKNSGGTTTLSYLTAGAPATTWCTVGFRYTASARTLGFNLNGVDVGTTAAGTARNLPGLSRVILGNYTANTAGVYTRGYAFANAAWTAADFAKVHDKFLALSL